ncbi:unnamed protein product [Ilex paraguariensis]|uniref:Uncharacterized protein n=1 Tax=Ilex paraguariensis TaxID=185542 RepID=A0ABC8RXG2_9AQUA
MSRQAHLPPRCPFQKKTVPRPTHDPISPTPYELYPRHQKSISQSSILEDQPAWLNDLLSDSDSNSKGILHRRSASDPVTLLDGIVPSACLYMHNDDQSLETSEDGGGFESACIYGPNSPRSKGELNNPEHAIVSALSEYVSQNPLPYLDGDLCISGNVQLESVRDGCGSPGKVNAETKPVKQITFAKCGIKKLLFHAVMQSCVTEETHDMSIILLAHVSKDCARHSGQRSRVRKLQYIAELERTVHVFQTLESDLAVGVASLLQQRVVLSMENNKLKQQLARLQQEKLMVDDLGYWLLFCLVAGRIMVEVLSRLVGRLVIGGQYQSLRKEVERLKICLKHSPKGKASTYFRSSSAIQAANSEATWQMLDLGKLDIN